MESTQHKFRLRFMFQEMDLSVGSFYIGRSPDCNLTLEDPLVSRRHARINVMTDNATIDDLGSRNGTKVNGEPAFDGLLLHHKDRIHIGSHDMLFIELSSHPSRPMRATGAMATCRSCAVPYPIGVTNCPHCKARVVVAGVCMECQKPLGKTDKHCTQCGTTVPREDATIPVDLGAPQDWTAELLNDVIAKAISAKRYEHAASLLEGKIEKFELLLSKKVEDISLLRVITEYGSTLAKHLAQPERLDWIFEQWLKMSTPMPRDCLHQVVDNARQYAHLTTGLKRYRSAMGNRDQNTETGSLLAELDQLIAASRKQ